MIIIIETPKASREKYKFDATTNSFKLKKLLPLGMVFPYDFGFIPGTKAEDGDPVDGMVISEFVTFPGARLECRLIGALLAEQKEGARKVRNDRYFFIPDDSVVFKHIKAMNQFGTSHNEQLRDFFINYNKEEDKEFLPLQWLNSTRALQLLKKQKE
jgi:inorganic pyrophosphatase